MSKKKKSGSIAIPFLLTILISVAIIGSIVLIILEKIDTDKTELVTMTGQAGSVSENDSHTILFVIDLSDSVDTENQEEEEVEEETTEAESEEDSEEGDEEEEEIYDWEVIEEEEEEIAPKPYTFVLMRSVPVDKQMIFTGLPDNMIAGEDSRSLADIYESDGAAELKAACEYTLEVPVDRYMVFNTTSFRKMCNIMGGVEFAVTKDIGSIKQSAGMQYLGAEQIEDVITFGGYGGEIQRVSTVSSLLAAMANQTSGTRIADNLDNTFNLMVNSNDTDISALDYQEHKYAIKFMLKYSDPDENETVSDRAEFLTPFGTQTKDKFVLDTAFLDEISQYYVTTVEATEALTEKSTLREMTPETGGAADAQ